MVQFQVCKCRSHTGPGLFNLHPTLHPDGEQFFLSAETRDTFIDSVMGWAQSKPEFITVLDDKQVKMGQTVTLHCKANMEAFIATWEKNGQSFSCVQDKHKITKDGTSCKLEIVNAQEGDEGRYTLTLKNKLGSTSCSACVTVELNEWRRVEWKQDPMIDKLKSFKIANDNVKELRFLLFGPVGAGKSSIINTIKTIFNGRQFINCLAAAETSISHTIYYEKYSVEQDGLYPFAFSDIMGIEKCEGVLKEDIITACKGHVKEGYTFHAKIPLSEGNEYYLERPTLTDKIHCLVNVVPADKLSLIKTDFLEKMKAVRVTASRMSLPQVVFLTRVDRACPMTKANLRNIYNSKKIRDKVHECSNALGVPANCIFPVWNYHEEMGINEDINCLMLHALTEMVHWAHDYVVKCSNKSPHAE
ncbi:hypothetical protein NFI96_010940 [Prochilodus magdalenae]|nr:hypothetical protein NFI96_010940 [Prochilodus magdalenae]